MAATFAGYGRALADGDFAAFVAVAAIMNRAYLQLYSTLWVYLRDVHGISTREYGYLMSLNATMVVLLQFWVYRQVRRFRPLVMMALGTALYLVGFTMFGLVHGYTLFVAAVLLVTAGEMVVIPVSQALVTGLAPEEMRGRYMATFGLSWSIPCPQPCPPANAASLTATERSRRRARVFRGLAISHPEAPGSGLRRPAHSPTPEGGAQAPTSRRPPARATLSYGRLRVR